MAVPLARQRAQRDALRHLGGAAASPPGFAQVVGRRQWTEAADIADLEVLAGCARAAGLDATAMLQAIQAPELKEQLRATTERAWQDGVQGVPTVRVGEQLFFGDDRLEEAAAALNRP